MLTRCRSHDSQTGAIKTGSSPVVTEPRAVATGLLSHADFFNKQRAGRYRSRFSNDGVAFPPADSHFNYIPVKSQWRIISSSARIRHERELFHNPNPRGA